MASAWKCRGCGGKFANVWVVGEEGEGSFGPLELACHMEGQVNPVGFGTSVLELRSAISYRIIPQLMDRGRTGPPCDKLLRNASTYSHIILLKSQ